MKIGLPNQLQQDRQSFQQSKIPNSYYILQELNSAYWADGKGIQV